jgi:hypothetical protein
MVPITNLTKEQFLTDADFHNRFVLKASDACKKPNPITAVSPLNDKPNILFSG